MTLSSRLADLRLPLILLVLAVPMLLGNVFGPGWEPLPQAVAETPLELLERNLAGGAEARPGEVLVVARAGVSREVIESVGASLGCAVESKMGWRPFYVVQCSPAVPIEQLVEQWWLEPEVSWVEASYLEVDESVPDDLDEAQWHHQNDGQVIDEVEGSADADINSLAAWEIHTGSSDVVIAPIDNGLHYDHEDLADRMWLNPDEICDNGEDDSGTGYVDDCWGWDTAEEHNDPTPVRLPEERPDGKRCSRWHGTMVGGLAAATGDNGVGLSGVGWNFTLMNLKRTNAECRSFSSNSLEAAAYAIDNGAHILVMSFNTSAYSAMFESILKDGDAQGVISVMSGGNGAEDSDELERYPNNYDLQNRLVVANTTNRDELSPKSNWGAENIDLAAPGNDLFGPGVDGVDDYRTGSGTSYAAPLVAGTAALVLSAFPEMSGDVVVNSIRQGVHHLPGLDCAQTDRCVATGGRLDVYGALRAAARRAGAAQLVYLAHSSTEAPDADQDGRFEPDERVDIELELANQGGDAEAVTARLRALPGSEAHLSVVDDELDFGSVLGGMARVGSDESFTVEIHPDCSGAVEAQIEVDIRDVSGYGFTRQLAMTLDCDVDYDNDGHSRPDDCDDDDPEVHPDAEEVCDGRDTNCDGTVDEDAVDRESFWRDDDGDGYGDPAETTLACRQTEGYLDNQDDCDDTDPGAYPGAPGWSSECERTDDGGCGCTTGDGRDGAPWALLLAAALGFRAVRRCIAPVARN